MRVLFFDVDNVLNFEGSEAKAPDGSLGIAESRVKKLRNMSDGFRLVLIGPWKKEWNFDESKCTAKGTYLNKKLDRKGLHILDKTKDDLSDEEGIEDWLQRHPNVTDYQILKELKDG